MKHIADKLLLLLLRTAVYGKRGASWLFFRVVGLFSSLHDLYANTVGFRLYKILFFLKKKCQKYQLPLDGRIIELLGRRGTLQVLLFLVIGVILLPQSKLYSQDITSIPGRNTLLYRLVGPGDQNFVIDEIIVEEANLERTQAGTAIPAWKQGTLSVDAPSFVGKESILQAQDLSAMSVGGSALTKPSILPGIDLPAWDPANTSGRKEMLLYQVQSGDVIGSIAEEYGVSLNSLLWANNLTARSYIRPGDTLKIPPSTGLYHKVAKGDTVSKIAQIYTVEPSVIISFNNLQQDGADIVVGEELFVPDGEKPAPKVIVVPRPKPLIGVTAPAPSVSAPAGSGYLWPTAVSRITQYFGFRHTGVDIAGPSGTALYASRGGTVVKSQCGWNGGYGCYIIIDHGGGVQTLYGHVSELYVSAGQQVSQGQTIAAMGSTGRSTGPHIHFEVRVNGAQQNPLRYIR